MCNLGGLFATKQQTNQNSTNQGTTQSNYYNDPNLQAFQQQYNQQFSSPSISSVSAPANAYQYGAANNQTNVVPGLNNAFGVANNVANTGLNPNSIASFQSPYQGQVIQNTLTDLNTQNARQASDLGGTLSKYGALTGSQGGNAQALLKESQNRTQNPIISNLYNQGFNTAAGLAGQSAGLQLAGTGQVGQLSNTSTNANNAQNNIGEIIRQAGLQNQTLPFTLNNQGLAGQQLFGQLSGVNSTGSSTGSGTTTSTPGFMQSLLGLGGLGQQLGSAFGGGGGNFDPFGMIPFGSFNSGGPVLPPAPPQNKDVLTKMQDAFHALQGIRSRASGGGVDQVPSLASAIRPGFADAGAVGDYSNWSDNMPLYGTAAAATDPMLLGGPQTPQRGASAIAADSSRPSYIPQPGQQTDNLLPAPQQTQSIPTYNGQQTQPTQPAAQPQYPSIPSVPASTVAPLSKWDQFGLNALNASPIAGFAKNAMEQQQLRQNDRDAQLRAAQLQVQAENEQARLTGTYRGQQTLEGAKNPASIAALQAQSVEGQKDLKTYENQVSKDLAAIQQLSKSESDISMAETAQAITPDEANRLRQNARELYQRTRGQIQDVTTPAKQQPTRPSGNYTWAPGSGIQ